MTQHGPTSDFEMSHCSFIQGDTGELKGPKDDFETLITFHIPEGSAPLGNFEIDYKGSWVGIDVETVEAQERDSILQFGATWRIGHLNLPFIEFTDNKGKYPCLAVTLAFPYRLASWMDLTHPTGLNLELDYEEFAIAGAPKSPEKIVALVILNRFIREALNISVTTFSYDSVTAFMECYFRKGTEKMVVKKLTYLASESAYIKAVAPHVLKDFHQAEMVVTVAHIAEKIQANPITSEGELLTVVFDVIEDVIRHHIENRRWISAFWDGERTVTLEGKPTPVPRAPKGETDIQPTLHVLLFEALTPLGIQVVAEPDEGIGRIDFRCLFTTANQQALSIAIEFKLAHHGNLQKGIRNQLPAYLKATKSRSGIYSVMWFKDVPGKYWKKPSKHSLTQLVGWLKQEAALASAENTVTILTSTIDASVKPSASKL